LEASVRDQRLWTWHLAAGAVILVLLGLHMTVMHLSAVVPLAVSTPRGGAPIDWANVAERARSGFFLVSYVFLLGAALFHGFYGLRNIVFELNPGRATKTAVNGALVTAGLVLFVVGTWAAWTTYAAARGPVA
jgi:succinate dehydrogenase / fumarate reductase membrane anchor subunit